MRGWGFLYRVSYKTENDSIAPQVHNNHNSQFTIQYTLVATPGVSPYSEGEYGTTPHDRSTKVSHRIRLYRRS